MTNKQQAFFDLVAKLEGDLESNKRVLAAHLAEAGDSDNSFAEYLNEQIALYRVALGALYRQLGPAPEVKS